nr:hypothetical protein [Cupriavidus sp. IK-TO18]
MERCTAAARGLAVAGNQREANVFRLAAMILSPNLPVESRRLMVASELYFAEHPDHLVPSVDVVRNGWIIGLPRLRDMLTAQLRPQDPVPVKLERRPRQS